MESVLDYGDVDIENVAFFKNFLVRNSVANLMIDRDAGGFRIRSFTAG